MLESFVRSGHKQWDLGTHREVVLEDCYRLANRKFSPLDIILDVGANIGFFSGLALEIGAGLVIAAEPSPKNFDVLTKNLAPYTGRHSLHNRAVWRSDMQPIPLHLHEFPDDGNTGGISVLQNDGEVEVMTISLDDLIGTRHIRFLKVDCEGSEYPILYTTSRLGQVQEIAVETHPVDHLLLAKDNLHPTHNNPQDLARHLVTNGFKVQIAPRQGMSEGWAYVFGTK